MTPIRRPIAVGTDPGPTFVGNFNGQTDLVTVNAGSNDLTLISGFNGPEPVTTTISSGGVDPATAFEFSSETGFDDLVVGNGGDGVLALFEGSSEGPDAELQRDRSRPAQPLVTGVRVVERRSGPVLRRDRRAGSGRARGPVPGRRRDLGPIRVAGLERRRSARSAARVVAGPGRHTLDPDDRIVRRRVTNAGDTEAIGALARRPPRPASLGQPVLGQRWS